jgi:DNA-binding LacI/PurR family transcriptional regulator
MDGVLTIGLDNRPASRRAAEHLRDLGHERVAVVALPLRRPHHAGLIAQDWQATATSFTATERLLGVQDVFPDLVGFVATGSDIDAGREAGLALLQLPDRPTAILAQSDLLAVGVFRAAEELGIQVPAQLSLIGFDGIRIDGMGAQVLTTFVQPAVEKGRAAGQAVLDLLAGEPGTATSFASVFREGTTTAPAPRPPAR